MKKVFFFFALLLIFPVVLAGVQEEVLLADNALLQAQEMITELSSAGFSTQRLEDIFLSMQVMYASQVSSENPDFSSLHARFKELSSLRDLAFEMSDEILVLEMRLEQEELDMSSVYPFIDRARADLVAERYENINSHIIGGYAEIDSVNALSTRAGVLLAASRDRVEVFFERYAVILLMSVFSVVILFFVARTPLRLFRIRSRIRRLFLEQEVVRDLIKKAQKEYFEEQSLAESQYQVRIAKYGDLLRDINRQIPLLREQEASLQGVKRS